MLEKSTTPLETQQENEHVDNHKMNTLIIYKFHLVILGLIQITQIWWTLADTTSLFCFSTLSYSLFHTEPLAFLNVIKHITKELKGLIFQYDIAYSCEGDFIE